MRFTPLQDKAASDIRRWREDPVSFVREVLKVEPDEWQVDVLRAFSTHNRIALKACKGPGKSTVMAWCGWNFLLTRLHPKVIATSITGPNLRSGLWTEFAKWQQRSELLRRAFAWSSSRIVANDHPETWWAEARSWPQQADATQQADSLAGVHADYLLFLLDEVGSYPNGVVAAAEAGLATGKETKLFISGNPTDTQGPLYRVCTRDRALWFVKEISSDPEDPKRTPRVSLQWAQEQIDMYGREHPFVLVNVLGQFPPSQSNTLIGVEDASAASRRSMKAEEYVYEPKVMGVDVAYFGDDRSVICRRQGKAVLDFAVFRNLSLMELAGQVALAAQQWKPDAIFVDRTGVGAGTYEKLLELGYDNTHGIDFATRALTAEPKCANRRAEMWWLMAEWLKAGGCIPDDAELISELTGPTYTVKTGAIQLESKDSLKKRGLPSPDKADALALTFALPVPSLIRHRIPRKGVPVRIEYDPLAEERV